MKSKNRRNPEVNQVIKEAEEGFTDLALLSGAI
jgi:hypothetical protein